MSAMSDPSIPLSMLTQFHREVVVPDIERIVGASERRLLDEMHGLHDASLVKFEHLETEFTALKAGLRRVEERLDSLEVEQHDLVAEVRRLDERLSRVEERLSRVEERMSRVEKRLDELVVSQPGHALQADVRDLRARLDAVEAQIAALRKPQP